MYFVFGRLYPFSPRPQQQCSVPIPVISLLLTNTLSSVRAFLSICCERFRGTQKEDDRGPLSIPSSLVRVLEPNLTKGARTWFSSNLPSTEKGHVMKGEGGLGFDKIRISSPSVVIHEYYRGRAATYLYRV
jgi:hypothetical protein